MVCPIPIADINGIAEIWDFDLFEGAANSPPFYIQRKAELLILMERAVDAKIILRGRTDLEENGWIQRLLAQALFSQKKHGKALNWINEALQDGRCESHFHEFWEHRYEIRTALGVSKQL